MASVAESIPRGSKIGNGGLEGYGHASACRPLPLGVATGRNGMRFDNRYCWVMRFETGLIVQVRAYLDSALVAQLFRQNPA